MTEKEAAKFITKRELTTRLTLEGDYSKGVEVLDALHALGFRVVRCGPKEMPGHRYDPSRFFIVAEKVNQTSRD